MKLEEITFEPLTTVNWDKFVELFGNKGASDNCWCMYYRLKPSEYKAGQTNNGNKKSMHTLIRNGKPAGLMAVFGDQAIAWCALAPRRDFIKLENSRKHKAIDNQDVWSIPCLFIHKNFRKKGISALLIRGVVQYARETGIRILEAYPKAKPVGKLPDAFAWHGFLDTFEAAGFQIVDRKSANHPMVRLYL